MDAGMYDKIKDLVSKIFDVDEEINRLTWYSCDFPRIEGGNRYAEGHAIVHHIEEGFFDMTHDMRISCLAEMCVILSGYVDFREKFAFLDHELLADVLQPTIDLDVKRRLKHALRLSNRETLDMVAKIRKEGAVIMSYGGYREFMEKIVLQWVPQFEGGDDCSE